MVIAVDPVDNTLAFMDQPEPQPTEASPGSFTAPEEFRLTTTFLQQLTRMIPLSIMLLVLTFLLALGLLNLVHLANPPVALLIAVASVAVAVVSKKRQWDAKFANRTLVLDPVGAHVRDRDFTIDLPWPLVDAVSLVPELGVWKLDIKVGRAVAASANAAQGASEGLIGAGILASTLEASAPFRAQIKQNLAADRVDPRTGQPAFGVPLATFDLDWRSGRIGQWLTHYRPDLAAGS